MCLKYSGADVATAVIVTASIVVYVKISRVIPSKDWGIEAYFPRHGPGTEFLM